LTPRSSGEKGGEELLPPADTQLLREDSELAGVEDPIAARRCTTLNEAGSMGGPEIESSEGRGRTSDLLGTGSIKRLEDRLLAGLNIVKHRSLTEGLMYSCLEVDEVGGWGVGGGGGAKCFSCTAPPV